MPSPTASVSVTENGRTAVVTPIPPTTPRALERLLREAGLVALTRRGAAFSVPIDGFLTLNSALARAGIVADQDAERLLSTATERSERHRRSCSLVASLRAGASSHALVAAFDPDPRLDTHQAEAAAVIAHPDVYGLCLFDEQGLGKTVTTLFAYDHVRRRGEVGRLLIFSPKSMLLEWVHDAKRFFGDRYRCQPIVGDERGKLAACDADADIYVTNFETAARMTARLRRLLDRDRGRAFLVVDESFYVKNSDARRTQGLRDLRAAAGKCVVLCGTPAPNSPHDIVEQFNIADGGETFRGVVVPEGRDEARPVIAAAIDARGVYLRRLKQHVLDLPERLFNRITVPMQPRQQALYQELLTNLVTDLLAVDTAQFRRQITSFMARRTALLQTCSHPGAIADDYDETPAKALALDSILGELIDRRGEKVVLWSYYRHSIDQLVARYERYAPLRFDGSVTDVEVRREAVRRFQEDDGSPLFIANPAAAGAGITLHRARYAVYESLSNQAAHYLQSLDRVHRRGQARPVEYVVLLCANSVEEVEYERLLDKQASSRQLLGDDDQDPPTRDSMLNEALAAARALGLKVAPAGGEG